MFEIIIFLVICLVMGFAFAKLVDYLNQKAIDKAIDECAKNISTLSNEPSGGENN